jgi:dTDP-4-amino-4,6-dideoxygalactose transaminase
MGMIKLPEASIRHYKQHVDEIFETGFLSEGGWNTKLGDFICKEVGAKYALPVSSNGTGIAAVLSIFRHYNGRDLVAVQSNTMYGVRIMGPAVGYAVAGFVNCQLSTLMPSLNDVKEFLAGKTGEEKGRLVLLLSHIGGIVNPDIAEIATLCKDENVLLVEDCAHSFGATLNEKHSGLFGDAGVYSFYSTKAIPAGEGGIIVTNDDLLGDRVYKFSIYDRFDQVMEIGFNNRISEIQALLTYSVVKEWKAIVADKVALANKYIQVCEELGIDFIQQHENGQAGNYYKFIVTSANKPIAELLPKLQTKTSPVYDYEIGTPNPLYDRHFCLPIWYAQEEEVGEKVIAELRSCFI